VLHFASFDRHLVVMLDLSVAPERSVGNEQWEFVLGKVLVY